MIEVDQKEYEGKRLVWGSGPPDAQICFIGTAPGIHEYRVGRPFYERAHAGGKLQEVMHLVGLSRQCVYMTNVIKEMVSDDSRITPYIDINSRTGKVTTSLLFNIYATALAEELRQRKDTINVFVPLGNIAMWTLTAKLGITKWRGSILEGLFWPGMKVIPSIHPSAIAGEGSHRGEYMYMHYLRMDLKKVLREAKFKEIVLPQRILHTEPDFLLARTFLERCRVAEEIGVDIEVLHEEVGCISFSLSPLEAMSIDFVRDGQDVFTPDQEVELWQTIAFILENKRIKKGGQNITFDASFLYRKYGIKIVNPHDTMVAMGIAFPDFPKSLPFQTAMYTDEPYYKDEGKKWLRSGIGTEHNFHLYNAKDAAIYHEILPKVMKDIVRQGNERTYERQRALIPILVFMQERGTKVDTEGLTKARVEAGLEIERLTEKFKTMCGCDINPNSPDQIMNYFYKVKGLTPYLKQGKPTSDYHALVRLARRGIEEAALLRDIRKVSKLKSTYFDVVLSADGRLKSSKNPVGTTTGRLSSSESIFGEGTNDQNLPDSMRKFLVPDDGYVGYSIDINQGENRIVAYTAPEHLMIQAFENKVDIHRQTASLIFRIPLEEVSDEPGSSSLGNGDQSQRFWGKKSNHALNYDMSYGRAALEWEIPENEAKWIVERYHAVYPGVRQKYHLWIKSDLSKNRVIENPYGRKRLFLDRWGDQLFKDAYAHFPQSTVADKIDEDGLIPMYYVEIFNKVEILNQIHDEIVFQISLSAGWKYHAEILVEAKRLLEKPISWKGTTFVLPVEAKIGVNFAKSDMRKVTIDGTDTDRLARQLSEIYGKLRTTSVLPTVDRNISNGSSPSKEMSAAVRSE